MVEPSGIVKAIFRSPEFEGLEPLEQLTPTAPPTRARAPRTVSFAEFRIITVSSQTFFVTIVGVQPLHPQTTTQKPFGPLATSTPAGAPRPTILIFVVMST